jgi:hypothetical protein
MIGATTTLMGLNPQKAAAGGTVVAMPLFWRRGGGEPRSVDLTRTIEREVLVNMLRSAPLSISVAGPQLDRRGI